MTEERPASLRVVVLGGGLAGVACAHRLGEEGVAVIVVDRNDYHQFQPLLYQVASSQLPAEDVARPHRTIFRDYPTVEVRTAEVTGIDPAGLSLTLSTGETVSGSHLVIAAGARPQFFGVPGAAEHSFPLYSVADAERLRLHLQSLLRASDSAEDALHVVVVGGGPTGVETSGALAELMAALGSVRTTATPGRVTLVDRGSAVLGAFSSKSQKYAAKRLSARGVDILLGTGVTSVHPDHLQLDDNTVIGTRTVVWGGGESASRIVQDAGLATGRGGRLDSRPDLSVDGHPRTYAIGDAANTPGADGKTLPQLGSVAQQSGRWAAENILREMRREPAQPFAYKDKGIMAMIGRNAAVAEVGKNRHQVEGPLAFAAWLGVHAMLLSGAHSKTDAFMSWAWDYFDRDHAAILEASATPKRIAWDDDATDRPHIRLDPVEPPSRPH